MSRIRARCWWLLAVVGMTSLARAADPVKIENVRVGLGGAYKVGAWAPVSVDVQGGQERFVGVLMVEAPDEDGTPTTVRLPLAIAPGQLLTLGTYIRPGSSNGDDLIVRVRDERGRPAARDVRAEVPGGKTYTILDPGQTLIVTLGHAEGVAELPALPAFSGGSSPSRAQGPLAVVRVPPRDLPGRWLGLDAAAVVVLDTNDRASLDAVSARSEALREWVQNGGHLVVAGTVNSQIVLDVLGEVLPARPAGTTRLNDLGELESFAGSKKNPIPGTSMTTLVLEPVSERSPRVLSASTTTPLVVRGAYGFGRVTMVGLDVDRRPFADWKDKALFWARALDLHSLAAQETTTNPATGGAFFQNTTLDLAGLLHRGLDQPPGVTPIPFGWVAGFVFLYILLIGPGDYFFLKRVLKRMELTWITFPLIVIATSAFAYAAAYHLKGTELKTMKVDVVDVDQSAGRIRGATWVTLFSPRNQDYDVAFAPRSLAGPAPSSRIGVDTCVSWFAPPDSRLGGGGSSRFSLSGSGYDYMPAGQAEVLKGVRVPIWSTKSFQARWAAPMPAPLIEADLTTLGADRLIGTLTNLTDHALERAVLIHGNQVYDQLGTIAAGASVRLDVASRVRPLSGYLEERAEGLNNLSTNAQPGPQPVQHRLADLVRTMMFRDGMTPKTATPPNVPLHFLDLTGQLSLDRPMLVAEQAGPAVDLRLAGGAPDSPPPSRRPSFGSSSVWSHGTKTNPELDSLPPDRPSEAA